MGENPVQVRSRNSLKRALISLMEEKPFDKISILDITSRANLSRQTFYTNFDTKEEILEYSMNEIFEHCTEALEFDATNLLDFLNKYFRYWEPYVPFLKLLLENGLGYLFLRRSRLYYERVIRPSRRRDARVLPYIRAYAAGVTYELLSTWIKNNQDLSIDEISAVAYGLLNGDIIRGDGLIDK